ncbi:iron uptake transporter deferrochelatase/peroxidase subunit [Neisseria leonii]|uniref:Deferrochelatase n=1 Tax=Neisseria leonii TaxID=2995413 RepID=A0A9X4E1S4_9NEIS|nr:iron uptake transporter deferrochelatase/peroxidase subunit [Neisseria sp. 51.81]MDD9327920.1 iron uptake transporter deferrochelatase/peroxidase subunit [Neisseria sp. 51.81]
MTDSNAPERPARRTLLKTALAVGAAGAASATGGWILGRRQGAAVQAGVQAQHSAQSYPCYGTHQAGITTPHQPFGIMTAFDTVAADTTDLEQLFRIITARIEFLTQGGELIDGDAKLPPAGSGILGKTVPPDGLTVTLGVGASLFDGRFGLSGKKPRHLQEMTDFSNDRLQAAWCDGDISLQICAFSPETCQNALRDIIKHTARFLIPRWSMEGFLPKSAPGAAARNLFGFRDGSANPDVADPDTAKRVLWTGVAQNSLDEPAWAKNGSYQAVRLIRHFVEFWDRTPLQEQEAIFGREKYSGAPLGMKTEHDTPDYTQEVADSRIPADSHIRLANPRSPQFMRKHLLFRRPFNYSRGLAKSGQLDVGLMFICYQANLADGFIFVQKLLDFEPLEEYISPFGGGYFFILPGVEKGGFFGQGLLAA